MKVRIVGPSDTKQPEYVALLRRWQQCSGQRLSRFCYMESCRAAPTVGALVQRAYAADSASYIVPLCAAHSAMIGETIELAFGTHLVQADMP